MTTNTLVPAGPGVPAFLANLNAQFATLNAVAEAAATGISGGGHPRISIKGGRFRLQQPGAEDMPLNQYHLDTIVVGANAHLSKTYYKDAYDPNATDVVPPTCFSDNGVGPSVNANSPQCATCAHCPHNVLGSKISPTGGKLKACADSKKIAVLLADIPGVLSDAHTGPVYELRMPYMSAKNFTPYAQDLLKRGVNIATVITRITFNSQSEYPNLQFSAAAWFSEAQAQSVMQVAGTDEVNEAVGSDDVARMSLGAPTNAPAPVAQIFVPAPAPVAQAPVFAPQPAPAPVAQAPVFASQPAPAPIAQAPVFAPQPAPEPAVRKRRTKAEMEAARAVEQAPQPQVQAQATVTPFPGRPDVPGILTPAAATAVHAPTTNAALDALLTRAMGK